MNVVFKKKIQFIYDFVKVVFKEVLVQLFPVDDVEEEHQEPQQGQHCVRVHNGARKYPIQSRALQKKSVLLIRFKQQLLD